MTIREWIRNREIHGKPMFSLDVLRKAFPQMSEQSILNALSRLKKECVLYSPYSSFYVTLPPQYVLRGAVPAYYYMDPLMTALGHSYYFGLLSAAVLWGAAHQRPQRDIVVTTRPRLSLSSTSKRQVRWVYRNDIPTQFLREKSGEAGKVVYSCAELTALDLVQFERHSGGLSVAATVLEELLGVTDFRNAANGLFQTCNMATIQRLGYIVEVVLGETQQGETIYREWRKYNPRPRYVALSPRAEVKGKRNGRWNIVINTELETDET